MKEYTYYKFWDALCEPHEPDYYRMGPKGLEFQLVFSNHRKWLPSGFADIDDLMENAVGQGRYEEVDVDG